MVTTLRKGWVIIWLLLFFCPIANAELINVSGIHQGNAIDNTHVSTGMEPVFLLYREIDEENNHACHVRFGHWASDYSCIPGTCTSNRIQSFDSTGFVLGNNSSANSGSEFYGWIAIKASSGKTDTSAYTGNGSTSNRAIVSSFQPEGTLLIYENNGANNNQIFHKVLDMSLGSVLCSLNSGEAWLDHYIVSFDATPSITVDDGNPGQGNTDVLNGLYDFVYWNQQANVMDQDVITGDGAATKTITTNCELIEAVIVSHNSVDPADTGDNFMWRTRTMPAGAGAGTIDTRWAMRCGNGPDVTGCISDISANTGSFTLTKNAGDDVSCNESGDTYSWMALCAEPPTTPTSTPTNSPTNTPTRTPTGTPTVSPTFSNSPTPTDTNTETPTSTVTVTNTPTVTDTPTKTPTPTATLMFTQTSTLTPTRTDTPTRTPTFTDTPSRTPTPTRTTTPTSTPSITPSGTPSATPTRTSTRTVTNTVQPSNTPLPEDCFALNLPESTPAPADQAAWAQELLRRLRQAKFQSCGPVVRATAEAAVVIATATNTRTATITGTFTITPTITITPTATPTPTETPTIVYDSIVNSIGDDPDADSADGNCETATPGECTYRAAWETCNLLFPTKRNIGFNIAGSGPHTIVLSTNVNSVCNGMYIDGGSQPGSTCGDLFGSPEPDYQIVIDGGGGAFNPVGLDTDNNTIRGVRVTNSASDCVNITGSGNAIRCSQIDSCDQGLSGTGVGMKVGGNWVGAGVVIGNNATEDVAVFDTADLSLIQGSYIGWQKDGVTPFPPNEGHINVEGADNIIVGGSSTERAKNLIFKQVTIGSMANISTGIIIVANWFGLDKNMNCVEPEPPDGGARILHTNESGSIVLDNEFCPPTPTPTPTPVPATGCCGYTGSNGYAVTCVDNPALIANAIPAFIDDSGDCQQILDDFIPGVDSVIQFNPAVFCDPIPGSLGGTCNP